MCFYNFGAMVAFAAEGQSDVYENIELIKNEVFRPRYDSLAKDLERLHEHVSNLYHADRLTLEVASSFACIPPAAAKLEDNYFAQGLYAEIETQYARISLDPDGEGRPPAIDRLIAEGQGQRVIRGCWASISEASWGYWYWVDERRRGFRHASNWAASAKQQEAEHRRDIARIPELKAGLLAKLDVARGLFEKAGATDGQCARLATIRADVEAEERQRPEGKPDPRTMDITVFWEVISTPDEAHEIDQIETVINRLARFKPTAIKAFDGILHEQNRRAFRSDLWALAYLLQGGCSDDAFEAFRSWLILQGRTMFESVLEDPDNFDVSQFGGNIDGYIALQDIPLSAYQMRTGKPMRRKSLSPLTLNGTLLEEEEFANALPRVAAAIRE